MAVIKATWHGAKIVRDVASAAYRAALETCMLGERKGKEYANGRPGPNVVTSFLKSNVMCNVTKIEEKLIEAQIGDSMEYAEFVEFGTSRSKPYPYIRPAISDMREAAPEIFEKHIGKVL
jgi:HK97 gp10 family phage protein